MTRTQITAAILANDGTATAKLLAEITAAATARDEDAVLDLMGKIFQAGRHDAITDIVVDLKSENYSEPAEFIEVNYL